MRGVVVLCTRAYTQLCTWYIVARCALMRQWIQDHVSSPVGANLNRVTKLSNLYLCIHWECNEIGARARAVLVLSFVKQADKVRTAFVFTLWWNPGEKPVDPWTRNPSYREFVWQNLSWLGSVLEIARDEKYVATLMYETYVRKIYKRCPLMLEKHSGNIMSYKYV